VLDLTSESESEFKFRVKGLDKRPNGGLAVKRLELIVGGVTKTDLPSRWHASAKGE
jgi:hypothetical protein